MKENKLNKLKSMSEANLDLNNEDWLEPSEKVWKNVKENLPKKKRRRNVLPFFFLLIGISAASILYGLMLSKDRSEAVSKGEESMPTEIKNDRTTTKDEKIVQTQNTSFSQAKENSLHVEPSRKELEKTASITKNNSINDANSSKNKNLFLDRKNIVDKENIILTKGKEIDDDSIYPSTTSQPDKDEKNQGDQVVFIENRITAITPSLIGNKINSISESKKEALKFNPNKIVENVMEIKRIDFPVFFGLGFSGGITSNKKNAETGNIPLSELIKSSVYKNNYSFNFEYNKVINNKLSYSFLPSLSFDQLYTTYVLNIPYDYNTEIIDNDEKENTFSHSLPTDIGNIKTKLVVTRAANSPVVHNEIINFDFTSKHQIINLSIPLRLNYHFTNFEKGFYIFPYIAPEYELFKKLSADYLKSNHTFVHTKSAEINQDFEVGKFHLGLGAGLGYRLKLMDKFILNIHTNYTQYLNSHGRSNLLNTGTSLLYKF